MWLQLGHFTLTLWALMYANAEDCAYKECDCSGLLIDCGFHDLTQMPAIVNLSDAHGTLDLSFNKITDIPANSLPSNLSAIFLVNNPTTIIADTALDDSVHTLQSISLSLALFTRIPNALGHLRTLKSLTIQDVNVQDWNDNAMSIGGQTLTSLYLNNVSLSSWPNWIQNCSQLTELTLTHGSIQSIPDGAFDKISTRLTRIDLSNNSLTSIPKAFFQLLALTSLKLENNNIVDLTWLPQHTQLATLHLNSNKISNSSLLSQALRQIGSSLTDLGISSNQLTTIPNCSPLTNIADLDFSNNKISDPSSGSILPTIYSLDLSYNFLPTIPRFVSKLYKTANLIFASNVIASFVGTDITASATFLDLGYNLITELTDNSFPDNSELAGLHLNNNPIVTISNMAFTKLSYLIDLDLQSTGLTRLPLALGSLNSLARLEMTDNKDLVCTCMEKSLASWVVNLSSYQVLGNCGEISIHDFFLKLGPNCPSQ